MPPYTEPTDDTRRGKLLVAKSFLALAVCAVSVTFISGPDVAQESLSTAVDSSLFSDDEMAEVAPDCWCDKMCEVPGSYMDHVTGETVITRYGTCTANKSIRFYAKRKELKGDVLDMCKDLSYIITKCDLQEAATMRGSKKNRDDCELVYFCGFETNEAGTAREKLMANGGTVWNVFPLACRGTPDRPAQVERSGATLDGCQSAL